MELISSSEPNLLRIRTLLVRSNLVFASVMDYAGKEMADEKMSVIRDFIKANRAWDYMIADGSVSAYTRECLYDFGRLLDKYENNKGEIYKDCDFLKAGIEKMEAFFEPGQYN